MKLKGKRVLITGATGGIGRALCSSLIDAGCHLILVGRSHSKLEQLIKQLPQTDSYLSIVADISCREGMQTVHRACQLYKEKGVGIDIVINNAGCNTFDYLAERTEQSIEQEIAINISAPILLSKYALSWLSEQGVIVNIGSTFAAIGYPGYATYCASKAALHRFTEAMQRELQDFEQRMVFIAPRATDTRLNDQRVSDLNRALGNHVDSPQIVAQQIVKTLQSGKQTQWIGWPEKLLVRINQLFPNVVAAFIGRQKKTINNYLVKNRHQQESIR